MEAKKMHMIQSTIIILRQGWTNLLSKRIISNQTRLPLLIIRKDARFNKQLENNIKVHNLLIEPTKS